MQREATGRLRLIQCGSCSLSPVQKHYAAVKLELCTIWWAAEKCDFFLRGYKGFTVKADHKPLVGVIKKPLAALGNSRLQWLREHLTKYQFTVE